MKIENEAEYRAALNLLNSAESEQIELSDELEELEFAINDLQDDIKLYEKTRQNN
jgi:hypothetical protein